MAQSFQDLHILINTIHSPSIMNSSAAASFLPICLPKFNAAAFVNAYVTFLRRTEGSSARPETRDDASITASTINENADQHSVAESRNIDADEVSLAESSKTAAARIEIGLVCVCGLADFEAVRGWCNTASEVGANCLIAYTRTEDNWTVTEIGERRHDASSRGRDIPRTDRVYSRRPQYSRAAAFSVQEQITGTNHHAYLRRSL